MKNWQITNKLKLKMIHIKHILAKSLENISKKKFYQNNQDKFLRYFDSANQYQALILAGNFGKIEEIIKAKSSFDLERFLLREF